MITTNCKENIYNNYMCKFFIEKTFHVWGQCITYFFLIKNLKNNYVEKRSKTGN